MSLTVNQKGREIESDAMVTTKGRELLILIEIKKWRKIYLIFTECKFS